MNEAQKITLRRHNHALVHDLDLSGDLTSKFIHLGLFNEDMIERFQSEKTRKDKNQKMLFLLTTRGPRAFDMFVHAIHDTYPWLAEGLRKTHSMIKPEHETLALKQQVDIHVHEHFGNSKRLCEEDKKEIRRFLYRQLKGHQEGEIYQTRHGHHDSEPENENVNEQGVGNKILKKIYSIFGRKSSQETTKTDEFADFDEVDGPKVEDDEKGQDEITLEMIESKVNELTQKCECLNNKVEGLQNEINDCYSVLGIKESNLPLHEVLNQFTHEREAEHQQFAELQDNLEKLQQQRKYLEKKLKQSQDEFGEAINKLANSEHQNEKTQALMEDLHKKCDKLQHMNIKHAEKEQTLLMLKDMVKELNPNQKQRHNNSLRFPAPESSNPPTSSLQLPQLVHGGRVTRRSQQLRHRESRDRSQDNQNELPQVRASHGPWK